MCGIAGLIAKKQLTQDEKLRFIKSSDLMTHRGPDYKGIFENDNVLLIHHRLSIIDLDKRAHQPFFSSDKQFVCVYNGEIYNFQDLKKKYSIPANTSSDTEIMLSTFINKGHEVIKEWNGIFGLAIYDQQDKKVHLIRDRLGVKPLYLYEDHEVILFASEAKVILNWLSSFSINKHGLSQYMWYGNTTGEQTIVNGMKKVPPGSQIIFDTNTKLCIENRKFWDIDRDIQPLEISEKEAVSTLQNKLELAIKRQLISDVPIGVLLSGGIDSSSIVAFASKHVQGKLDTYSVGYDYNIGGKSELNKAKLISDLFRTNHHELHVTSNDVKDIFDDLVFQFDEPFADSAAIPLYQLARECSKDKKVILQGDGGDELFAGYRRYNVLNDYFFWKNISRFYPIIPDRRWKERMKRTSFILNQKDDANLMAYYLTQDVPYKNPYQVFNMNIISELDKQDWKSDYEKAAFKFKDLDKVQKLLFTDISILLPNTYLEKVDKATMKCSLEARVPFLDDELAAFALSLPANLKVKKGQKKYLLKEALKNIIPNEILYGPKRGFDVPYKEWLKKDLYNLAEESFSSHKSGILDKNKCLEILNQHKQGISDNGPLLWKTLILNKWIEIYSNKIKW